MHTFSCLIGSSWSFSSLLEPDSSNTCKLCNSQQVSSSSKDSQTASQAENLDGIYKGTDETDQITLTLSGTSGTWEEVERDGEKESKPVTVHTDKHTLTVGDDLKYYKLEGNQLTIEDDDRDPSDTIVLTK
ncbi:SP_0198 family lipoprotein [uncultured Streptococcus sp.]|uniref:SP_0198 family lipoprotein n=1 Tax=uncultured Streptococcus sp. TaxID=83427 RepID=UPI0028DB4C73|nr:SP_0198 family lipoprotein [uncultured Streptococcus sp.]